MILRARGLLTALQGVTIDQFVTLFALAKMDPGLYPGTNALFPQGDPTLLREDLILALSAHSPGDARLQIF